MFSSEDVKYIVDATANINNELFPLSTILPILLATTFLILFFYNLKNPTIKTSNSLKVLVGLIYLNAGIPFYFQMNIMGLQAIGGTSIISIFALTFILALFHRKMIFIPEENKYLIQS